MDKSQRKRNIVIIGGGIIGCTTAYYLTRHPKFDPELHRVTLLEATALAANASGKAGGLLALWAYPDCLVPLSYRLHAELAKEHGGAERWGYRRVQCGSLNATVGADGVRKAEAARAKCMSKDGPSLDPNDCIQVRQSDSDGGGRESSPARGARPDQEDDKEWEKLPKQDDKAAALLKKSRPPPDLDWVDESLVRRYDEMGRPGTTETSQVHPYYFTTSIGELAREAGVDIRLRAKATRINYTRSEVESVEYQDRETLSRHVIDGVTDVVVTAGPWTGELIPRSKVEGVRSHSVVLDAVVAPYALFTSISLPPDYVPQHRAEKGQKRKHRGKVDPEIYARPFGKVYACGETDWDMPLPETADLVDIDEDLCDDIVAYAGTISPQLAAAPVQTKQACYLPRHSRAGKDRGPIVGPTSVPGLFVAAGHTCWGIQNGPATGFLMAEMLLDGEAKAANIGILDPRKFKV